MLFDCELLTNKSIQTKRVPDLISASTFFTDNNDMNPKLIDFIVSSTHLKTGDIRPELRLAEDIGYYGLDAISFFEKFFAEFKIKSTENFDLDLHIDGSVDFAPRPLN